MSKIIEFKNKLSEIFETDKADLDFGIYRIMNQKREEINKFMDGLEREVKEQLKSVSGASLDGKKAELEKLAQTLADAGVVAEQSSKYQALKQEVAESIDISAIESDIFSHLTNFFGRYYSEGDFISQRRYKNGVYALPYEGEEVKLHWANQDQYYVKTSENFNNYVVRIGRDLSLRFKIVQADTEQNNNKEAEGKERRFILLENDFLEITDEELIVKFVYTSSKEKQDKLNKDAAEKVIALLQTNNSSFYEILSIEKLTTEGKSFKTKRNILEHELTNYTAKNSFDYFIHKDLAGFLKRELDFYIKNEVMFLDDLDETVIKKSLAKVKAIKNIGATIIQMAASIEDFQKKLWLKKKFVVETNYCATLDKVPVELYGEILANSEQLSEWEDYYGFVLTADERGLTQIEQLKQNDKLVIDTKYFSADFKERLIASIDNLDDELNGLLIHSENFQALNLLQEKYREKVKCVYIDPPYNTGEDDFSYKDKYKSSSWVAMLNDRMKLTYNILNNVGILACHMDEHEHLTLEWLIRRIFGESGDMGKLIWDKRNPKGDAKGLAAQHEYVHFATTNIEHLKQDDDAFVRNKENAEIILSKAKTLINRSGKINEQIRKEFKEWINSQYLFSGGEKAYNLIDDNGDVYRLVSMAWPNKKKAPDDYFIKLIHPKTGKECPLPSRGWRNPPDTMNDLLINNKIVFGDDETTIPNRKYLLKENLTENVPSLYYMGGSDDALFIDLQLSFVNPKPVKAAKYFISTAARTTSSIILDYFAGSGTTGHAVIDLNREDGGNRKYILVEMGEYFDTVTKPRIKKVIFSKDWKDGKPVSTTKSTKDTKKDQDNNPLFVLSEPSVAKTSTGISQIFKYIKLEQYEDTLNNLELKKPDKDLFEQNPQLETDYQLNYALDFETKSSQSLLNIDNFANPFAYQMKIAEKEEIRLKNIDLVETFNYLIGLEITRSEKIRYFNYENQTLKEIRENPCDSVANYKIKELTGKTRNGEKVLIIWRNRTNNLALDNEVIEEFFKKQRYNILDMEFDKIYINGDNTLQNLKKDEESWKVELIEEKFKMMIME